MAEEFDPDFARDERLFHYTSASGLYGILQTNCLWASHYRFLNDSKEFQSARDSLVEHLKYEVHKTFAALKVTGQAKFDEKVVLADLSAHEAEVIFNSMHTATMNIGWWFVFSGFICEPDRSDYHQGTLLHWATYGRNGGYALRLNPHKIHRLIQNESKKLLCGLRSSRVYYAGDKPPRELASAYEIISKVAKEMIIELVKGDVTKADVQPSLEPFERLISVLKDPYFFEEREARIVVNVPRFTRDRPRHEICMRHRGSTAIPYVRLFEGDLLGDACPIEAIIIGPQADQERRRIGLETVIESRGLDKQIEVITSQVPYVNE